MFGYFFLLDYQKKFITIQFENYSITVSFQHPSGYRNQCSTQTGSFGKKPSFQHACTIASGLIKISVFDMHARAKSTFGLTNPKLDFGNFNTVCRKLTRVQ